jgi:homoserine O-acetyltransferase
MGKLKHIEIPTYTTENDNEHAIRLSYQVFGKPLGKAPIVLVNHALTANACVIGPSGWWNQIIGVGKSIDTEYYTILAFNVPGNGFDVTPGSMIEDYKDFKARDIAQLFLLGLKQLNINSLFAVIGGSMGGGVAWEMAAVKPKFIEHLIPIAADWKSTDWILANCYIQDSILNNSMNPLFDARLHAMTLYRTPESFSHKFQRTQKEGGEFKVESWLNYHGNSLANRYQLSAYKLMNQILKTVDITRGSGSFLEVASKISSAIHIITINSDLFFKTEECWKTYTDLKSIKNNVSINEIISIHGHDSFLIESEQLSRILNPIFQNKENVLFVTNKRIKKDI